MKDGRVLRAIQCPIARELVKNTNGVILSGTEFRRIYDTLEKESAREAEEFLDRLDFVPTPIYNIPKGFCQFWNGSCRLELKKRQPTSCATCQVKKK